MEAAQTSPDQVPHALPAREFPQTSFTSFLSPSAIPNLSGVGFWIYWRCREHNVNFVCVWTDSCWWRHFVGRRCLWRLDVGKSRVIRDSQWGWKRKKDWLIDLILCIYTEHFPLSVQTGSFTSDINFSICDGLIKRATDFNKQSASIHNISDFWWTCFFYLSSQINTYSSWGKLRLK